MLSPLPRRSGWAYSCSTSPSRISLPRKGCRVGLRIVLYKACSAFTRVTACTLALSPIRDTHSEGFSHFVTSLTAPGASGWSGRRVGLAPTGKRRLSTAHATHRRKKASDKPRKMTPDLVELIEEKLTREQWSPDQISGRLAKDGVAFISHERIYQHVWKDKKDGGALHLHLRHSGKKYNKRKGKNSGRGLIPNRVDIDQRPSIVAEKSRIGDWEADTIIGANHRGAVMSHVERKSKYTKL